MKVYIAEQGLYEERNVAGIFDSPERAMAAMPGGRWVKTTWTSFPRYPDRSEARHWVSWDNDLDWNDAVHIVESEIVTEGPLRAADEAVVQTYRASDGGWEYLPESDGSAVGAAVED